MRAGHGYSVGRMKECVLCLTLRVNEPPPACFRLRLSMLLICVAKSHGLLMSGVLKRSDGTSPSYRGLRRMVFCFTVFRSYTEYRDGIRILYETLRCLLGCL